IDTPLDNNNAEDMFATPYDQKSEDEDLFGQDFNPLQDRTDPFAKKITAGNDFDDEFLHQEPMGAAGAGAAAGAAAMPPSRNRGNILKRHPFLTLLVVILIIFGGYRLMQRAGTGGEMTAVETGKNQMLAEHQVAKRAPPEIQQLDQRLDALEKGMLQISEQLQQMQGAHVRIEQMEQMVTTIAEEERNLTTTLTQLQTLSQQVNTLSQMAQHISTLDAEVRVLASEVELYTKVSEQTQRAANLSRQATQAKSMIPVPMVVQAAIPGRAWLLSEFGELITVARGDEVPGYGRVLNIDPVAGTVTMSSETVFREK
ncbi:MAG TPA: hypothetical protein VI522_01485, partial [Gammaproteobacteria bacterium]|nr:hypothetical protein [Gammaproteobacteria bacterium]